MFGPNSTLSCFERAKARRALVVLSDTDLPTGWRYHEPRLASGRLGLAQRFAAVAREDADGQRAGTVVDLGGFEPLATAALSDPLSRISTPQSALRDSAASRTSLDSTGLSLDDAKQDDRGIFALQRRKQHITVGSLDIIGQIRRG